MRAGYLIAKVIPYLIYGGAAVGMVYSATKKLLKKGQLYIHYKMSPRNGPLTRVTELNIAFQHKRSGKIYYTFEKITVRFSKKFDLSYYIDWAERVLNTVKNNRIGVDSWALDERLLSFLEDYNIKLVHGIPSAYQYFYIGSKDVGMRIKASNNMVSLCRASLCRTSLRQYTPRPVMLIGIYCDYIREIFRITSEYNTSVSRSETSSKL